MTFILVIHSITCVLLVLTVLMQAGRGGGLTESFSSAESVFGAQTSAFMVRTTSILATVFFTTSLVLALMSSRQERSLMADSKMLPKTNASASKVLSTEPLKDVVETTASMNAQLPSVDVPAIPKVDEQPAPVLVNAQK